MVFFENLMSNHTKCVCLAYFWRKTLLYWMMFWWFKWSKTFVSFKWALASLKSVNGRLWLFHHKIKSRILSKKIFFWQTVLLQLLLLFSCVQPEELVLQNLSLYFFNLNLTEIIQFWVNFLDFLCKMNFFGTKNLLDVKLIHFKNWGSEHSPPSRSLKIGLNLIFFFFFLLPTCLGG